ncbi:MAG TPA: hypothetical protein VGF79_10140 [Bacteroidia bacterium]
MKRMILALLMALPIFTYSKNTEKVYLAEFNVLANSDTTITLTATEMGCKTDAKMVEIALYRKSGVKKVVIDGDNITVTFNSKKITAAQIISVIENTGTCEDPNAKVHKVKSKS